MSFEQASPNLSCACWESSGSSITSTSTISCWRPASNRVKAYGSFRFRLIGLFRSMTGCFWKVLNPSFFRLFTDHIGEPPRWLMHPRNRIEEIPRSKSQYSRCGGESECSCRQTAHTADQAARTLELLCEASDDLQSLKFLLDTLQYVTDSHHPDQLYWRWQCHSRSTAGDGDGGNVAGGVGGCDGKGDLVATD